MCLPFDPYLSRLRQGNIHYNYVRSRTLSRSILLLLRWEILLLWQTVSISSVEMTRVLKQILVVAIEWKHGILRREMIISMKWNTESAIRGSLTHFLCTDDCDLKQCVHIVAMFPCYGLYSVLCKETPTNDLFFIRRLLLFLEKRSTHWPLTQ